MKRKNGFTLIEVLTVIIVLAIIALIAVPVIMGLVGKAQKSAFTDSAYELIKAGDLLYSTNEMEGAKLERKTFTFPNDTEDLDVKGELPTGGEMKVYENGEIAMAVTSGKYCATKKYGSKEVVVTEDTENCELPKLELGDIIYFDPTLGEKGMLCTEGDYLEKNSKTGYKDGCMRWYVYNNSIEGEFKLILDHNTTSQVAWLSDEDYRELDPTGTSVATSHGSVTLNRQLSKDTANWKTKASIITRDDLFPLISWYDSVEEKGQVEYTNEFVAKYLEALDTNTKKAFNNLSQVENPSNLSCIELVDKLKTEIMKTEIALPAYLHQDLPGTASCHADNKEVSGYWTITKNGDDFAWLIFEHGYITSDKINSNDTYGLRPVITITQ